MLRINRIFIFFFLTVSLYGFSQKKLPNPDLVFLKENKINDNALYDYFKKYIGTVSGKRNKKYYFNCKDNCLCFWEETFKNNIKFKQNTCSESGLEIRIDFLDYSKDEIVKLVNLFYKTEFNQLNKNRTSYTPIENDAGCYIDIIKVTKRTIRLTISCGC
jgi:hypothetical protein